MKFFSHILRCSELFGIENEQKRLSRTRVIDKNVRQPEKKLYDNP